MTRRPPLVPEWRREALRTNLWLVPGVEVALAVALFAVTHSIDRAAYRGDLTLPAWTISGTADAARQILTALAAAVTATRARGRRPSRRAPSSSSTS